MLDTLTSAHFAPCLHQVFRLSHTLPEQGQPGPLECELVEVQDLGPLPDPASLQRRPFSLIFRAPTGLCLPQCIYTLEHAALGSLDLFLVPLGPGADGMRYQAVFN